MDGTSKTSRKSARDIAYFAQRYRNRVYSKLVSFIAEQCEARGLSQKDIAHILGKDPGLISRWLSQPSNLTLDTVSQLALAFDAEPEPPTFVLFSDRSESNHVHSLVARVTDTKRKPLKASSVSTTSTAAQLKLVPPSMYGAQIAISAKAG